MVQYKQYIVDRCDGESYGGKNAQAGRPPMPCCWVPPCVKWCPGFLEQNPIVPCRAFGRVGCTKSQNDDSTSVRRIVFTIGLLANIVGLALTVFACFAVSKDHGILTTASFSQGRVDPVDPSVTDVESIEIWIGLRAVAGRNPNTAVVDTVTGFDEFCDALEDGLERYINDDQCGDCEESSQAYVGSVISSTVLYLPSIFTDILRMYPTYDLNCQKFYGAIVAFISIALTMFTLINYSKACFDGFYQGQVQYFTNSTPVPEDYDGDEPTVLMDFDWESGNGLICLSVATGLKLVDAICNLIVPVPSIAYTKEEQEAYELEYGVGGDGDDDLKLEQQQQQQQEEEDYEEEQEQQ